jgi:NAD(P)-dependent dehydrogenase (short-subunit alcohol dehydrogenase family)
VSPLGKIAIVTGGGSGIGEALSQELARRGATVVVADINSGDASRVAAAIGRSGGRAEARQVDVSSEDAVRHVVEETAASYGRLDYLFNNAGIGIGGDARDLTSEHWRQVLNVDLFGVVYGTLAAYPIMARQGFGHIVNTSSAAGLLPGPFNAPYNTSKHAVVGLSLSLRIEAADLGVKVSVVCPGFVRTRIYQTAVTVNIPQEKVSSSSRLPARMMAAPRAAQIILDGVDRNQAMIVFPASIRCVWRAYRIAPGLTSRLFSLLVQRRIRELRSYRLPPGQAHRAADGEGGG